METCQRHRKPSRYWHKRDVHRRSQGFRWLNGPSWLQTDEEKWPKPWCQVNEAEAEHVTSSLATETELDQLFDWRRYNTFNRIRKFIVYCMRFTTKQKGPLNADEIHQAEQKLFRFVQTESFPNVSKSIANSKEISKSLNFAKLSPFIEEDGTIRVKGRPKHSNFDYNAKHPILLTAKHPVVQILLDKAHRDNLHEDTENVLNLLQQEHWIIRLRNALRKIKSRCFKWRHTKRQPNPPTDGRPTPRTTWWTCVPIHSYRCRLFRALWSEVYSTYLEKVVLPLYLPDNENSTHRSRTVIGHRVLSNCCDKFHCRTWVPKYHHQRQRNKFCWSSQRAENIHEREGISQDWKWLSTEKDCLEIQSSRSSSLWWKLGKTGSKLPEGQDCNLGQSKLHWWGTQHLNVSYGTNTQRKTPDSSKWRRWRFDSTHAKSILARTRERECTIHVIQWTLPWPGSVPVNATMLWKRWTREYLPQWNQRSNWSKEHVRNLKEGELVWLVDDSVKRCQYKLVRINEIFTGNNGVLRSARVKMAHGELKRPVVKLGPVFYDGVS